MNPVPITIVLNGKLHRLQVRPDQSLLQVLRESLGASEVKNGCERGDCGTCVVLMDGVLVNSCLVLAAQADGHQIVTAKGMGSREKPHPIQEAFIVHGAVQCGFCTPGMILAAQALLDSNQSPTKDEIRRAVAGNYCRCTGYVKIVQAIEAASKMRFELGTAERVNPNDADEDMR